MTVRTTDVLIIEDDEDLRETLADLLVEAGYRAETASNGREALSMVSAGLRPRLCIVDLMMPIMNGWQFIDWLRSSAETASIPALVVTATGPYWGWPETARVLRKPMDVERLVEAVRGQLSHEVSMGV
jgi:DNA-binding response OmpR family regulator